MEGIIDKENERARRFFALLDNMEKKVERLARDNRPPFNGERFLTDRELSGTLKISAGACRITGTKDGFPISSLAGRSCTGNRTSRSCWRRTITLHWYNIVFKFKDCRRNCIYDSDGQFLFSLRLPCRPQAFFFPSAGPCPRISSGR